MSERKVLNKYFPADFDPSKIPRRKMPKDKQQVVRLMAPFSMRCTTCGEYIYKGKKFNARKETVLGEEYYGIKIFRFYIKCTQCSAEITFKTDPKNSDYQAEHGAQRNFEPWRAEPLNTDPNVDRLTELEEEESNAMAELESKAIDSKREMDILDALQELKAKNARIERAGRKDGIADKALDRVTTMVEVGDRDVRRKLTEYEQGLKRQEEEDEQEIRKVFGRTHVGGVPDIELEEAAALSSSGSEAGDSPQTPRDGQDVGSGFAVSSPSTTPASTTTSIKRKLDQVEPTPASLLSAEHRDFVSKAGTMKPPPMKKKGKSSDRMAAMLGIRVKK
ncbi:BZ3500_MvSof-1268-A1-R1_Chr7-1g09437 [Microbotryum saponariae]|uniref:Splicing factor YJU2 n=1 Tax=Microbotryum saponariae TaxID=289078 RepID=A0A2X0L9D2_9BASI|nr:BZ3501_MvSof-1269-A2-R1_Chr7-1g09142 [Microbotryum saponariae]SDA03444.1 BZ3500_MvSof-1268-A1-R1_Chr7-1g09437 [Microbotryum saponariae]